ncbi:alkyl hydroperoxide reductase/ Thiol specific antioxidant/ Mal allergen [Arcobacter nitrofigilis DSM 7299]|uniref:Alkyl hydroperoxide reductase/ Thiol specific antioxidant/ Mal allergen n=1 Tax=Arcobacter nitrofigilis (strain ATCC 33309 / DSM 7299 / CCUG 15893 / LMG 7604 / NCTC 12251 / CI) TaxID=572480 RepID=D5V563_ARCNC|nr:peroxiredoxin [Arcobacter nitrofigilis]ADG92998.1 alkyl hydroperoxide reductase/ Thiol specific antioxidant/ Mal allergen [Arcobacter nitrofigilis DSM 7299]
MSQSSDLAIPLDDGKCNHLMGMNLPNVVLTSTSDKRVDLSKLKGLSVLYFYPKTGRPDIKSPDGWDEIPGAKGCTPQSCSFRDKNEIFEKLNVKVYGISTQSTSYQKEVVQRLHLPYEILSDEELRLTKELNLPTFDVDNMILTKRFTLICKDSKIIKVFYPVFPPEKNPEEVLDWIEKN